MLQRLRLEPGQAADLEHRDPADGLGHDKATAQVQLLACVGRIAALQERLHAEGQRAVLLVLQGTDTSGKDGTIRRVFTGLNPQAFASCRSGPRRSPSSNMTPSGASTPHCRETIGAFNRSH